MSVELNNTNDSVVLNNTNDGIALTATSGTCGISHYWDGTILTITSDSGTSACDLKGEKGDIGARGPQGLPGDANLTEAVEKAEAAATEAEAALEQLGTARDEAVAAAEQVKAIVAGNEAYTKAESDNRFANAIKPTITGEAVAAYEAGNYPLQGLTLYGKTTQDGTPTPTAPIDLVNIGDSGSITLNVGGKNLFRDNRTSTAAYTNNGITFTTNADGTFTANGTNSSSSRSSMIITQGSRWLYLPVGTYTINSGLNNRDGYFQLSHNDTPVSTGSSAYYAYDTPITFTFEKPKWCWIAICIVAGKTVDNLVFKPQIEVGTVATEYEQYTQPQTLTINTPNGLPGIPVSKGGNYTDSTGQQWIADEIDLDRGYYIQRLNTITIDGTAGAYNTSVEMFMMAIDDAAKLTNKNNIALCNGYPYGPYANAEMPDNTFKLHYTSGNDKTQVYIKNAIYKSTAEWQAALLEKPLTIIYQLEIPVGTELTAAEIAAYKEMYSQYPNTTITTDSNAGIAATYIADTKLYIDKKFNELATALVAMGG